MALLSDKWIVVLKVGFEKPVSEVFVKEKLGGLTDGEFLVDSVDEAIPLGEEGAEILMQEAEGA